MIYGLENFEFVTIPLFLKRLRKVSALTNRLSSTIASNREMDQLYTMSQVSNITRKTKFSPIS